MCHTYVWEISHQTYIRVPSIGNKRVDIGTVPLLESSFGGWVDSMDRLHKALGSFPSTVKSNNKQLDMDLL